MKVGKQLPVVVAVGALIGLVAIWFNSTSARRNSTNVSDAAKIAAAHVDFGADWRLVPAAPAQAAEVAAAVAGRVKAVLATQKGPTPEAGERLAADTQIAVQSILAHDWTLWRDAMLARNMRSGLNMKATTELIGQRVYREAAGPAQWDAWSVEERFAWMWANPKERGAEIDAVAVDNVSASLGTPPNTTMLPGQAGNSNKAFFISPNEAALNDQIHNDKIVWGLVTVPLRLRSGERMVLYLRFMWDDRAGEWVPEESTSLGFNNPPRIWF